MQLWVASTAGHFIHGIEARVCINYRHACGENSASVVVRSHDGGLHRECIDSRIGRSIHRVRVVSVHGVSGVSAVRGVGADSLQDRTDFPVQVVHVPGEYCPPLSVPGEATRFIVDLPHNFVSRYLVGSLT